MTKMTVRLAVMCSLALLCSTAFAQPGRRPGSERPEGGRPPGPPRGGNPLISALDANADGKISKSEIENATKALKSLDKNNDGEITRDEMMPQRPEGRRPGGQGGRPDPAQFRAQMMERIMQNDKNKDGKLTKDEVSGRLADGFDRLDTNKDGAVDKKEIEEMFSRFGRGRSRGGEGGRPNGGRGGDGRPRGEGDRPRGERPRGERPRGERPDA